jgi:hypothetical protein
MTGPNRGADPGGTNRPSPRSWIAVALSWAAVGLPLLWGVYVTLQKAMKLFE